MTQGTLLEVQRLSKTFPGLKALDGISFSVKTGEVVGLVGQNGSGKSTLVKTLAGVHEPDPGSRIMLDGDSGAAPTKLHFIHQDLALVGSLSTVENLDLDHRLGRRALLPSPRRLESDRARALLGSFGVQLDVWQPVQELSAAERTIVAIARALSGWSDARNVLILDEPTASLHDVEVNKLFHSVRRVVAQGAGVIFVSHRLDEVLTLADRVVALRDGKQIADVSCDELDHDALVSLIVGRSVAAPAAGGPRIRRRMVLSVRRMSGPTIRSLDLDVHAGEIVGLSGVLGSGREQVAPILFGASGGSMKELTVDEHPLVDPNPRRAIAAGVAYIPAERHRDGAVMTMSVRENMTLPRLAAVRGRLGAISGRAEREDVREWIEKVGLRPPDPERPLELFSGGNQQKVVLAKWLRNQPVVLLMDEPTQGVDVGAKAAIFSLIRAAAGRGAGVLICSSDEKELASHCDRVIVMRDGAAAAELLKADLSEAALVTAALGVSVVGRRSTSSKEESDV